MDATEPINFREWQPPDATRQRGRLFTCGRPGLDRARVSIGKGIIDLWASKLMANDVRHIVSLLGRKKNYFSEFAYYTFRSAKEYGSRPTLQECLDKYYGPRFIVHEFLTVDAVGIPPDERNNVTQYIQNLLDGGYTVVIVDSAGDERTSRICEEMVYKKR